jgi:DNA-binding NarL/FixJ family response regulator
MHEALEHLGRARPHLVNSTDVREAAWLKYLAAYALEDEQMDDALSELESLPNLSVADRVRLDTARTHGFFLGRSTSLRELPDVAELVPHVSDPWVRTGWTYMKGSALVLRGRYADGERLLRATQQDVRSFSLGFGMPHVDWSLAAAELGLRHFARADRLLRKVEQNPNFRRLLYLQLNARALRARLDLAQHRVEEALALTVDDFGRLPAVESSGVTKAMYGEYIATRALTSAVAGDHESALTNARAAEDMTLDVQSHLLASASRAVVELTRGSSSTQAARAVLQCAAKHDVWDGLICAVRAVPALLEPLTQVGRNQEDLRDALVRANDAAAAKRAGLVDRSNGIGGALSPREREIMDHVRQGRKNAEIATSLVISVGTVKRHLDHVYAKLGARGRAEAIARYAEIEMAETDAATGG